MSCINFRHHKLSYNPSPKKMRERDKVLIIHQNKKRIVKKNFNKNIKIDSKNSSYNQKQQQQKGPSK